MTAVDFNAWYDAYCVGTDRHTSRAIARRWYDNGVPAAEAALWARFGFTFESAAPHRAAGRPPAAAHP